MTRLPTHISINSHPFPVGIVSRMKSVVLSTTEAEYVAVPEVVKEIKFLYQMVRSMEIKVPLPAKVLVDNVSAIWLANNSSVSERTKHVDLRADCERYDQGSSH